MLHGTYVNEQNSRLFGESALLMLSTNADLILAQFDNRELREAYGWTAFPHQDFVVHCDSVKD